jgi:hypothetical protein
MFNINFPFSCFACSDIYCGFWHFPDFKGYHFGIGLEVSRHSFHVLDDTSSTLSHAPLFFLLMPLSFHPLSLGSLLDIFNEGSFPLSWDRLDQSYPLFFLHSLAVCPLPPLLVGLAATISSLIDIFYPLIFLLHLLLFCSILKLVVGRANVASPLFFIFPSSYCMYALLCLEGIRRKW